MARDHRFKRWAYGTVPSLGHYVLIAQDRAEAEVATTGGEVWRSVVLRDASATLRLDAPGLDIPLAEVFASVYLTGEERKSGPSASPGDSRGGRVGAFLTPFLFSRLSRLRLLLLTPLLSRGTS